MVAFVSTIQVKASKVNERDPVDHGPGRFLGILPTFSTYGS